MQHNTTISRNSTHLIEGVEWTLQFEQNVGKFIEMKRVSALHNNNIIIIIIFWDA
jgi:hypothetical protein